MSAHFWPEFAILYSAALIGIACVTPYTLELTAEALAKAQERMRQPKWILVLLQSAQSAVLMGVATGLGLLLAQSVGLGVPLLEGLLDGKDVTAQALAMIPPALLLGIGSSVVLLVLEITVFWPRLPRAMRESFPIPRLWKRLLASVYGGTGARAGTPACAACVPRRHQPCGACGRHDMPFAVTGGTGANPLAPPQEVPGGRARACPPRLRRPRPAGGRPAPPRGWKRQDGCLDCTKTSPRYTYGRCDRCALIAVFNHFTPDPEARRALAPLKDALLNGLDRQLAAMVDEEPADLPGPAWALGTIKINHAALDALPRSRTTEIIRSQLVAAGCLPHRNSYAADFQSWLNAYLADVEPATNRIVLHEYGTWRLLQRIDRPRDGRPQTYATLQYAKTRIRSAHRFLAWLGQRNTCLAAAAQADVDEFLSLHAQLAGTLRPFLRWTTQTRNSRRIGCRPERQRLSPNPPSHPTSAGSCSGACLDDDSLDAADRVMGAIILTYAASLTKVLSIQMDDVDVIGNHDTGIEVSLALGPAEVRLPPVLDQLLVQHMRRNRLPANGFRNRHQHAALPGHEGRDSQTQPRPKWSYGYVNSASTQDQAGLRALLHLASRV